MLPSICLDFTVVIDMLEELVFLSNCESLDISLVAQAEGSRYTWFIRGINMWLQSYLILLYTELGQ